MDFNLDEETVNKIKGMLGNMSDNPMYEKFFNLSPEASHSTTSNESENSKVEQSPRNNSNDFDFNNFNKTGSKDSNFGKFDFNNSDFGNIDFETIMKAQSLLKKLNDKKGDNRSRLLKSLKPYMRDSRKDEIDKYSKMLRIADLLEFLNIENDEEKKHDK